MIIIDRLKSKVPAKKRSLAQSNYDNDVLNVLVVT